MSLELLKVYAKSGRGLITTAKPYIDDLAKCLANGESCGCKKPDDWDAMQKEADDRFTYCDPTTVVDTKSVSVAPNEGWAKLFGDEEIPEKSILVYDAILSTKDLDRDGDILHPEGMDLVHKMPVLWQHVWSQPVGVVTKCVSQDENRVVVREALADTELGKDAAALIQMGALRKSHGFLPTPGEMEVREWGNEGGEKYPLGFEIKKLHVFESSLVSVPSNASAEILRSYEKEFDGVCKAFSRGELHSPMVKAWAKPLYESRKTQVPGASIEAKSADGVVNVNVSLTGPQRSRVARKRLAKSLEHSQSKFLSVALPSTLPGSFEEAQEEIEGQTYKKLESKMSGNSWDWSLYKVATFDGTAVLCLRGWEDGTKQCYEVDWSRSNGKVKVTGKPRKVDIEASIVSKALKDAVRPKSPVVTPPQTKQIGIGESDPLRDFIDSLVT